jgi:hypothetical protein
VIGSLDLERQSLVNRPAEIALTPPEIGPADLQSAAGGDEEAPDESRLLQSMKMTVGTGNLDLLAYAFVCDSPKAEFSLRFARGSKVADARSAVARRLERAAEDVSLFFMGKALKEGFVIDRLRLGHSKITVYVRDLEPVFLGTAKARSPR